MSASPFFHPLSRRARREIRRLHSFSLVELLVVMAIVGILMAVTIPAVTSLMDSNNMNRAGQQVVDEISLAKQMASSKNINVELRIFKPVNASSSGYTELQLGTNSSTGLWTPISLLTTLPNRIAISESTTLSSAFGTPNATSTMTNTGTTYNATYYPFEFRPSGIMYPMLNISNYCLAVVPAKYAATSYTTLDAGAGSPIKNYGLVQINPVTATSTLYRP